MGVDRFRVDPTYRRIADGSVILGGAPLRLFRLSPGGQRVAAAIERGERLAGAHRPLTDRLSDAGAIQPEPATGPFTPADVTVVMPAHGALPLTPADPEAFATIVVDDASAPALTAPAGVTVIRRTVNGGPGAARNTGLAAVTTPLVAFVDTDVRAAPGWMAALLVHFADERVAAVAPRVRAEPGDGLVARYEQGRSPLDLGPLADRVQPGGRVSYVPAAALVCRVDALRAVGGFDEGRRVGEDVDLLWRLHEAGWRCRYEPASVVTHRSRPTAWAMLRQRADYGSSAAPLAARHRRAVPALRLSPWTAAVWCLLAARRPLPAAAVAAVTGALLQRKLRGIPASTAWTLALGGHARAGVPIAAALRRTWWPVTLAAAVTCRRARVPAAAAALPLLTGYRRTDRSVAPPVWLGMAVADDAAYGWGVWRGVVRTRRLDPLLPDYRSAR